jgi:hypothetical protein
MPPRARRDLPPHDHAHGSRRWAIRWAKPSRTGPYEAQRQYLAARPIRRICRYFDAWEPTSAMLHTRQVAGSKPAAPIRRVPLIVIAAEVTVDSPDFGHLEPMVEAAGASSRAKPRPPTNARSQTGNGRRRKGRAPARHRGAHLIGRQAAKQRGKAQPQALRFSSSSGPKPKTNSPKQEGKRPAKPLTNMRRYTRKPPPDRGVSWLP